MPITTEAMKTRLPISVDAAEDKVREGLAAEGFGVLTEIDVAATLKAKLDLDRAPYRILGACRPQLASQALEVDPDVGLLLPCNVSIYQDGDETVVVAMDPGTMVEMTGNEQLAPIADEARARLTRVVAGLSKGPGG